MTKKEILSDLEKGYDKIIGQLRRLLKISVLGFCISLVGLWFILPGVDGVLKRYLLYFFAMLFGLCGSGVIGLLILIFVWTRQKREEINEAKEKLDQ